MSTLRGKTDPAYFLKHRSATTGMGKFIMEATATKMVQLGLNDENLYVKYDMRIRPEDGGRFCVFERVEEQLTPAHIKDGRKPKVRLIRVYVIEDPNGGFTLPDTFIVPHLKQMRELNTDMRMNSTGDADPTAILNPFK